jgi:hypothetical protein
VSIAYVKTDVKKLICTWVAPLMYGDQKQIQSSQDGQLKMNLVTTKLATKFLTCLSLNCMTEMFWSPYTVIEFFWYAPKKTFASCLNKFNCPIDNGH